MSNLVQSRNPSIFDAQIQIMHLDEDIYSKKSLELRVMIFHLKKVTIEVCNLFEKGKLYISSVRAKTSSQ